jgi:hypothetical protein
MLALCVTGSGDSKWLGDACSFYTVRGFFAAVPSRALWPILRNAMPERRALWGKRVLYKIYQFEARVLHSSSVKARQSKQVLSAGCRMHRHLPLPEAANRLKCARR